jgi:hypothetical protein
LTLKIIFPCRRQVAVRFGILQHDRSALASTPSRKGADRSRREKIAAFATVSTLAFASASFAADMPTRQPPPPAPVVGKAPIPIIGKLPVVGKAPFGKSPPPPPPVVARG